MDVGPTSRQYWFNHDRMASTSFGIPTHHILLYCFYDNILSNFKTNCIHNVARWGLGLHGDLLFSTIIEKYSCENMMEGPTIPHKMKRRSL